MAEVKKKLKPVSKAGTRAGRKKPANSDNTGGGVKTLREAANKAVGQNSAKITKSLLEKTLGGNATIAKLLFSLAEGQAEKADVGKHRRKRSVALKLAAEPVWDDDAVGAVTEMGAV
jgi:hypothetical protein